MPANTATLIRSKIEAHATDPAPEGNNARSFKGREGNWLRVGDWRAIMDDQGNVLALLDIGPRCGVHDRKGTDMNERVTIPRQEYDRLRAAAEDLADLQSCDRANAALAGGAEHAQTLGHVADVGAHPWLRGPERPALPG